MDLPETRYAKTVDGLHLAYQVFGDGPPVVMIPPLISHVEMVWEQEHWRRPLEYVARSLRIAHFDKRGIGGSDRFDDSPTLEQRMSDIETVMDCLDLERAHLFATSEGGLMAQLFAQRHPERVDRMVLFNSLLGGEQYAETIGHWRDGDPPLITFEAKRAQFETMIESWGRDGSVMVEGFAPSWVGDAGVEQWVARFQRLCATPADIRRQIDSLWDIEGADPTQIAVPTLVVTSRHDRVVPSMASRWLATQIDGAAFLEVDAHDHVPWISPQWREFIDPALEFLLERPVAATATTRRFAVVLFTDVVESTSRSASAGDREWHEVIAGHDRVVHKVVEGAGGTVVKSTGDGVLATFDVPSSAIAAAQALRGELAALGLPIRAGLHAGEIEVHDDGDVSGIAVNLAARVEAAAATDEILVSSTVHDLSLGSDWTFTERGEHVLKGFDGTWRLYAVSG